MVKDCMEGAQVLGTAGVWGGLGVNQELIRPFLSVRVIPMVGSLNGGAEAVLVTVVQQAPFRSLWDHQRLSVLLGARF